MGEFDPENPHDVLIAEELEPFLIFWRTGRLAEELEDLLGEQRYQAWLALFRVRSRAIRDRIAEFAHECATNKSDPQYAVIYALEELLMALA